MYLGDILLHNLKAIMHLCCKPDRHASHTWWYIL